MHVHQYNIMSIEKQYLVSEERCNLTNIKGREACLCTIICPQCSSWTHECIPRHTDSNFTPINGSNNGEKVYCKWVEHYKQVKINLLLIINPLQHVIKHVHEASLTTVTLKSSCGKLSKASRGEWIPSRLVTTTLNGCLRMEGICQVGFTTLRRCLKNDM